MDDHEALISCSQVSKRYNAANQITGIDFEVKKGECLALCGGNGAGKSTIIKMLVGVLAPDSGSLTLAGMPSSFGSKAYKRMFGYMPDSMVFAKSLTGYEILHFFARLHRLPPERISDVLKKVGLSDDAGKKVSHYSKGMQQRLALAQALLADPPVLILDEPTNGLDPFWVVRFKKLISQLKAEGTTIVLSSHIMQDVEELADRVAFIHEGRLLLVEEVKQLCQKNGVYRKLEEVFFDLIAGEENLHAAL